MSIKIDRPKEEARGNGLHRNHSAMFRMIEIVRETIRLS